MSWIYGFVCATRRQPVRADLASVKRLRAAWPLRATFDQPLGQNVPVLAEGHVVGAGLASTQAALDVQRGGVSAKKIVVSLRGGSEVTSGSLLVRARGPTSPHGK